MKKKLLSVILAAVMCVTMLAGCGQSDTKQGSTGTGSGELVANLSTEPSDMFSATTTDTVSLSVLRHIMENLVMQDENDNVIPGCAESWTISEDNLTYTFKIREGMKWSNGEPVTAHDFVFGWKTLLDPATASEYAYIAYFIKGAEAFNTGVGTAEELGVVATSDYELVVTLERPTAYALDVFTFGVMAPINEKAYTEIGVGYGTEADKLVTNGPFTMQSWEHDNKIVLAKNNEFWNAEKVNANSITFLMINDTNAVLNAYQAGECDIVGLTADQVALLQGEGETPMAYDDGSCFYLEFNLDRAPLNNANLRAAIASAIDAQSFVDNILKNNSKAAKGFTPAAINGLEDKFVNEVGDTFRGFDVEYAKECYAKALEELGVDSVSLVMISDDGDTAQTYAAFVQEQLRTNLGLELTVNAMPFKNRLEAMTNKDFDIVYAGWGPDYNDPMTFLDMFETGNGNNHTSYSSAEYDALLNEVRTLTDPKARMEKLGELEKLLMVDLPIAPIYWRSRDYVYNADKISGGVVRTAFQDMNYRYVTFK